MAFTISSRRLSFNVITLCLVAGTRNLSPAYSIQTT